MSKGKSKHLINKKMYSRTKKHKVVNKHKKPKAAKDKFNIILDTTDKSLLEFKKNKSFTIVSKISDYKNSKIGELYDEKPIRDNMYRLCQLKIQAKSAKSSPINKTTSRQLCDCLFEKNKGLSVAELEEKVNSKLETPASQCITILDKFYNREVDVKAPSQSKVKSKSKSKLTKSKTTI